MLGADFFHRICVEREVLFGEDRVRRIINVGNIFKGGGGNDGQPGSRLAVVFLLQGVPDESAKFAFEVHQPRRAIKG